MDGTTNSTCYVLSLQKRKFPTRHWKLPGSFLGPGIVKSSNRLWGIMWYSILKGQYHIEFGSNLAKSVVYFLTTPTVAITMYCTATVSYHSNTPE